MAGLSALDFPELRTEMLERTFNSLLEVRADVRALTPHIGGLAAETLRENIKDNLLSCEMSVDYLYECLDTNSKALREYEKLPRAAANGYEVHEARIAVHGAFAEMRGNLDATLDSTITYEKELQKQSILAESGITPLRVKVRAALDSVEQIQQRLIENEVDEEGILKNHADHFDPMQHSSTSRSASSSNAGVATGTPTALEKQMPTAKQAQSLLVTRALRPDLFVKKNPNAAPLPSRRRDYQRPGASPLRTMHPNPATAPHTSLQRRPGSQPPTHVSVSSDSHPTSPSLADAAVPKHPHRR